MATCRGCGGDNAAGAARCQYCDQPLREVRALDLDWDVRTGGGATGRGRLRLQAPASLGGDAARVAVDAAFGAAVTALGPEAQAAQVEVYMRERLPALLPDGCVVEALAVESVSAFVLVGGAPRGAAQGAHGPAAAPARGCSLGCLALFALLACLPCGLMGAVVGVASQSDIDHVRAARVLASPEAALTAERGVVAIEGVVAAVGTDAPVAPDGSVCLWLSQKGDGGRTVVSKVESFRVGPLTVQPDDGAHWDRAASFTHEVDGKSVRFQAIRADRPITLLGELLPGGVLAGEELYVSTRPRRDAIADDLVQLQRVSIGVGLAGLLVTGLLVALWLRSRSRPT